MCGDLYGTDGTQFQPYPDTDLWLWVFISDLCRPLWLEYTEDSQVRGIDTYEYRPPASVFDMHDPDNYCYCPDFFDCAVPMEDGTDQWNFTGWVTLNPPPTGLLGTFCFFPERKNVT